MSHQLDRLVEKLSDFHQVKLRLSALGDIADLIDFRDEHVREMEASSLYAGKALEAASDAASILQAEEAYGELKKAMQFADRSLRGRWRTLASDFAALSTVGRMLRQFSDTEDVGSRMEALGTRAEQSVNLASAADLRDTINWLRLERSKLEAEKAAMTKNSEVDDFLAKLAVGEATLALLTPVVFQWIAEHGELEDFAIKPAEAKHATI